MRLRLEKRAKVSTARAVLVPLASIAGALLLGALLIAACGQDPAAVYGAMLAGACGRPEEWAAGDFYGLTEVLLKATPLLLCGLGVGLAGRLRYWNIGAEGQLVCGAVAATGAILFLGLGGIAGVAAGALAGAAWALLPALLRVRLDVNESLSTLLLNYVAVLGAEALYMGTWRDPKGFGFPGTAELPESAWLAPFGASRLHAGLPLALLAAAALALVLAYTRFGFVVRAIATNPRAVRNAGFRTSAYVVAVACLAGALAGVAGAIEITGVAHRLQKGLATGIGYTAVIVAALAQFRPIGTALAAFAVAALSVGGEQLQTSLGLPGSIGTALTGLVLLTALGGQLLVAHRIRLERGRS